MLQTLKHFAKPGRCQEPSPFQLCTYGTWITLKARSMTDRPNTRGAERILQTLIGPGKRTHVS